MAAGLPCPEHRLMTTEQPIDQPLGQPQERGGPRQEMPPGGSPGAWYPPVQAAGVRPLRRRQSDRVIGGVAGGLGDYLNVDPILIRAGFAGLMVFGGAGLVLYVLGWLLIPAQGQASSIVEATIHGLARRTGRIGPAAIVLVAIIIVSPWITGYGGSFYIEPAVFWALAIAAIGIVLLLPLRDGGSAGISGAAAAAYVAPGAAPMDPAAWRQAAAAPALVAAASAPVRPRERSPLGWYVIAGALLLMGALAVVDIIANVRVTPGQYFGAGLLDLGIGLVVGAWWGRARLIGLLALLILPVAVVAAFLTVPLEGGFGSHEYQPQAIAEVAPAYHIVGGRLVIDLSRLPAGSQRVKLDASVGVGTMYVIVPKHATVEITGTVQGGELWLLGRDHVGTDLSDHVSEAGGAGADTLVLTVDAGIGRVWIERSTLEGN